MILQVSVVLFEICWYLLGGKVVGGILQVVLKVLVVLLQFQLVLRVNMLVLVILGLWVNFFLMKVLLCLSLCLYIYDSRFSVNIFLVCWLFFLDVLIVLMVFRVSVVMVMVCIIQLDSLLDFSGFVMQFIFVRLCLVNLLEFMIIILLSGRLLILVFNVVGFMVMSMLGWLLVVRML